MRVIVTGGGTGGHIYPALAIADKFKEIDSETEVLYVGNEEGIEKKAFYETLFTRISIIFTSFRKILNFV